MTLGAALERLYKLTPRGMCLGLDRVREAAAMLGNPERALRCVQIAGTNGKGSVAALLAHATASAGLSVGLFTSPHLHRFSERIKINDAEIDPISLNRHLGRVLDLSEENPGLALTFFEIATLTAFLAFETARVDLAVLEVGLGGRLDATSIAHPALTAITTVGLDHTAILGHKPAEIAREKAAIARPNTPMVVGVLEEEALIAVRETTARIGSGLRVLGRDFHPPCDLTPPWPGAHQCRNLAVAFELFRLLGERDARLTKPVFADSLATAFWPGRFERLTAESTYILDCAHNLEATRALVETLDGAGIRPDFLLYGSLRDKPAEAMLALLRTRVRRVILVPPPIGRALDPNALAIPGDLVCQTIEEGQARVKELASATDTVLVTGSIFTVAAVRATLLGERVDPPVGL